VKSKISKREYKSMPIERQFLTNSKLKRENKEKNSLPLKGRNQLLSKTNNKAVRSIWMSMTKQS
jgi:hypothetical protein